MSQSEQILIEEFYQQRIQTQYPLLTTFFDNQEGQGDSTSANGWARHTISENGREFASLGRSLMRSDGIITIQIFTPKGTGAQLSGAISEAMIDTYSGSCTGIVTFGVAYIPIAQTVGAQYQTNVVIPYSSNRRRGA